MQDITFLKSYEKFCRGSGLLLRLALDGSAELRKNEVNGPSNSGSGTL